MTSIQRLFIFSTAFLLACNPQPNQPVPERHNTQTGVVADQQPTVAQPMENVSTEQAIEQIRTRFQQINSMPLKSRSFQWTAENCNNEGTATYYFDGTGKIVKVVETGAIGDGNWTTDYYYQDGRFIFSLYTENGGPAIGPDTTIYRRKYVYNDKVIRLLDNKTFHTASDTALVPTSKEYRILEAYNNKQFGPAFCDE